MNPRRIAAAAMIDWLVSIPLGAFIHHGVLGSIYARDSAAFRPDVDILQKLPLGCVFQLFGFLGATLMYAQLDSRRHGIVRGLGFGLLLGVVVVSLLSSGIT